MRDVTPLARRVNAAATKVNVRACGAFRPSSGSSPSAASLLPPDDGDQLAEDAENPRYDRKDGKDNLLA
jgi:hypothetical protein